MNRLRLSTIALFALIAPTTIFGQTRVASIALGPNPGLSAPSEMIINPATSKAYVFGLGVEVVDLRTNSVLSSIQLPPAPPSASPGSPGNLFVNPNTNRIYVFRGNQFVVIDGSTDQVIRTFLLPANINFAYTPVSYNATTNKFYVGEISPVTPNPGEVRILDGTSFATLAILASPLYLGGPGLPELPEKILVNAANNRVYLLYQVTGMQVVDASTDALVAGALCTATCNGLTLIPGVNGAIINPADNSIWVGYNGVPPTAPGGEDGAGGIPGPPFTVLLRIDGTTNEVTRPVPMIYGTETEMLGFDPSTGFIYMMATNLPTVPNPTATSPVIAAIETMLVVLDPNNLTATVADPSPMRRIAVNGQLLANTGTPFSCGGGFQSFEPIALDFSLGNIYWRCDATRNTFSSIVVSMMSFTDLGNVNYSQFLAQLQTTAAGQLSGHAMPVGVSADFALGDNLGPNHAALFFSTYDNSLMDVDPASLRQTTVQLGSQPAGIAVNPASKRAYVTDLTSRVMSVIDTGAYTVASRVRAPGGALIAANSPANQYALAGPSDLTADPTQINGAFLFDGAANAVTLPLQAAATSEISVNPATNTGYFADNNQWYAVDLTSGTRHYAVSDLTAAGTDTCQMTGISVNKSTNRVFAAGTCAAGGKTLAVFDGVTRALLSSVNVDAVMLTIGRIIVNPNTNTVYVEATILTGAAQTIQTASAEAFDGATLAHVKSIPNATGPFALNLVTNVVYAAGINGGVFGIDGILPGQPSFIGDTMVASAIAVDETSNLVYIGGYRTLAGFTSTGAAVINPSAGALNIYRQDPPSFLIQGLVLNAGIPQTGITATVTGPGVASTFVTGPNGIFATTLVAGTYTVTLSNQAFAFSPASQTFTVTNTPLTLPTFSATPIFHISGQVLTLAGAPVSGVTITAQGVGGNASAVTDAKGQYSLAGLPAGTYTVSPVSPINFYAPASQSVNVNKTDVTGVGFTVDPPLAITGFSASPSLIGAGIQSTGTVAINQVAPKGGVTITFTSSDTKTLKPPSTLSIPAGASSGTFTLQGSGVSTATTVTLTASYSGALALQPSSATTQVTVAPTDTVHITSATWSTSTQKLQVTATSTNPQVTLTVFLASNGQNLGTLIGQGNGTFSIQVAVASKPASINVKSNLGGNSGQGVTVVP